MARALAVGVVLLLATPAAAAKKPARPPSPDKPGIPVARLSFAEGDVEQQAPKGGWKRAEEGGRVKTGDRVRTDAQATARIEFPWMSVVLGPSSTLAIPASLILSTVLESGRVEQRAEADIIKVQTAEAIVRGRGRVVVRREGEPARTFVSVLSGSFRVEGKAKTRSVAAGQGVVVRAGEAPSEAQDLPPAPVDVAPGDDPVYALKGQPIALEWKEGAAIHHVQILPVGNEEVLIERDTGAPPLSVTIPWLGTFRWRVAALNEAGLEGPPSAEGYVCVVEK